MSSVIAYRALFCNARTQFRMSPPRAILTVVLHFRVVLLHVLIQQERKTQKNTQATVTRQYPDWHAEVEA